VKNFEKNCHCGDPATLIVDRYSASRILAVLLLVSFFVFAAGYFLGKRTLAQETMLDTERAAFADHVSFALNASHDHEAPADAMPKEQGVDNQKVQTVEADKAICTPAVVAAVDKGLQHRALLFGGTKKAVTEFANRLQNRGIIVEVRERVSKTTKGKTRYWYQAVTTPYSNKDDLMAVVTTITNLEKLKNVEIISLRSDQKGNA
jgi:hypothetical protein